jgi:hypothetical protein
MEAGSTWKDKELWAKYQGTCRVQNLRDNFVLSVAQIAQVIDAGNWGMVGMDEEGWDKKFEMGAGGWAVMPQKGAGIRFVCDAGIRFAHGSFFPRVFAITS